MDQILNVISIQHISNDINEIIKNPHVPDKGQPPPYTMHFSQNEDFFLKIKKTVTIPHFKIHHDVKNPYPDDEYTTNLASVLKEVLPFINSVIAGTEYFFDPTESLRPVFYKLYNIEERSFLYLVRLDLSFKPHNCEILEKGNNDITHKFSTENIFVDIDILPIEKVIKGDTNTSDYFIKQSISQTWVGETGRGYFIRGIWMDSELTKLFTNVFLPDNTLSYPYYPFICKYRTLTYSPLQFEPLYREKHILILDRSYSFLFPFMKEIENLFKDYLFCKEMDIYKIIKEKIDTTWYNDFSSLKIDRYLNKQGMKEYEIFI
ncbi:MAG: hypothetical protein FWC36_03495 [Spirochaetes bacterium]|nr:hypothetical protein [Spirochaetota bacterium]